MRARLAVLMVGALSLAGCSGGDHPPAAAPTATASTSVSACQPAAPSDHLAEVRGTSTTGDSLYALVFTAYPVPARKVAKIAWRMTGTGDVTFTADGPGGTTATPVWGPEEHEGSTWHRPGDEWGTGFRFTATGCWTVHVRRGAHQASVSLLVG